MVEPLRGLYPIVDLESLARGSLDPIQFCDALLDAGPPVVQLRAKTSEPRDVLELARVLAGRCAERGARLFLNDRADLAVLAGCRGVHVGQDDLTVDEVRRIAPGLLVGVSTHDLGQLEAALAASPDYIAIGPVFPTGSKRRPDPVIGTELLAQAQRRCRSVGVPLAAIGGITLDNVELVAPHCSLVAVIGALVAETVSECGRAAHTLTSVIASARAGSSPE